MSHAIRVHETGGPEVMKWEEADPGNPGEGQVLVRNTACGLNFIDVYFRTGLYKGPELPFTPGMEGAGVVEAVGKGVSDLSEGDRVAYAGPIGAYAERRLMPADRLVPVPGGIEDQTAAAMMLKGMTAQYLLRRAYPVQKGDTILIHAAAGGVGLIACQWAKSIGATVIGTVGSEEKAKLAADHGCDHPIVYTREDFVERVKEITGGAGCAVVYDSVGRDTFERSLDCQRRRGMMVTFGQSSGPIPPVDTGLLNTKGSLYMTRPTLVHYIAERQELLDTANELFEMVTSGKVRIEVQQPYALKDAVKAHQDLEGRRTTGSTVLIP